MSNNPYKSTTPDWAYTGKATPQQREWQPREDSRPHCRVCGVPMSRAWLYINVDGKFPDSLENKFSNDDFCSVRCLKRRLNGLPNDDEQAMTALLHRVEVAEQAAKDAEEVSQAHAWHIDNIRTALAAVLETAPGLVKGVVAPPGALLARQVATLQSLVQQRVFGNPPVPRARRR